MERGYYAMPDTVEYYSFIEYCSCKFNSHYCHYLQVCSLLWSKEYKELVSGHGYAQNQIVIWKYPMMQRVTELLGTVDHPIVILPAIIACNNVTKWIYITVFINLNI